MPPARTPDQKAPRTVSPTGVGYDGPKTGRDPREQAGDTLTTPNGVRIPDSDHSLKAGPRGPVLLEDFHLREKIMHFDHERIPERVVHARGAGAHGVFTANGAAAKVTRAAVLAEKGLETPVFVRFSTVLGSRGSADTVRDTRGFATKFYTKEGTWDLVGNNIPVFFIQDAIKFPDIIHAGKPHPDREIPQAQSAHDTFWDFVTLHTEATHHTIWNMSDRGIPRSYRTMEGFGVHTFRLVNAERETALVKFHWKPRLGVHSLTWEEAQIAAGVDPDFHRRDLYDAIENGAFPEWDLGIQVFPDTPEETFEGIDLLDPTKIVPEELAPVQIIGTLVLNGNPTNFFAETEQVAFHTGHLVPGIESTNDPLLQGRNFSYLDTQLTRLGGPNFTQIPINRPHAPVNDNTRDGFHQQAIHTGQAPYTPNSVDDGVPFPSDWAEGGYVHVPRHVEGDVVRAAPASFDDHFSQAAMFYASLTSVEQQHIIDAYTFELGKCYEQGIKERALTVLAKLDENLCTQVAARARAAGAASGAGRAHRRVPRAAADQAHAVPDRRPHRRRRGRPGRRPRRHREAAHGTGGRGRPAAGDRAERRPTGQGQERGDRRADVRHRPLDRVRRDRRRRRRAQGRRLPGRRDAAGGVPAPEGRRRVGRRRRGARHRRHRPGGAGRAHRQEGEREAGHGADRRARHCTGPGTAPRWWPRRLVPPSV